MDVTVATQDGSRAIERGPVEMDWEDFKSLVERRGMRCRVTVQPFTSGVPAIGDGFAVLRVEFTDAERRCD